VVRRLHHRDGRPQRLRASVSAIDCEPYALRWRGTARPVGNVNERPAAVERRYPRTLDANALQFEEEPQSRLDHFRHRSSLARRLGFSPFNTVSSMLTVIFMWMANET
jgi:hypothetical protein